ncbi:hypothetical protein ACHAXT_011529 [Thalassiosira profunda]
MDAPTSQLRRSARAAGTKSPHFPLKGASKSSEAAAAPKGAAAKSKQPSKSKRKAKSASKGSNKKPKAKAKASGPVKRTSSFEPVWWGNVLTSDAAKRHPHAAAVSPAKSFEASYPPVHTLILGTHPSIASLDRNQMFGHDLNAYWYIAGDALGFRRSKAVSPKTGKPYVYFHEHLRHGEDEILEYPQQIERLVSKGFAMWDIVAECEREGSLDQDIKEDAPNPIRDLCEGRLEGIESEHLAVQRIAIANGTTGSKAFVKHFKEWFLDGKLCAASDDMSQRAFKSVMNQAKKVNRSSMSDEPAIEVVCLPGVSPAAAKFTYLEKRSAWDEGCYGPGLADYDEWKKSRQNGKSACKTPETKKRKATKKSASKSVTPSPSKSPSVRILSSDLAKLAPENKWVDLEVPATELRPSSTLTNGQCFNWMVVESELASDSASSGGGSPQKQSAWGTHDAKEWVGPLRNRVISIRETPATTQFRVLHGSSAGAKEDLQQYFRLETPLAPLYKEWSNADARLSKIAQAIPGVRILRQDPVECMFSFICSSNNNIPRITKMLSAFRERYGSFMLELPIHQGEEGEGSLRLYSFPTLDSLGDATEEELREMGLGYRAKYIIDTRNLLVESGGGEFLLGLRSQRDSQQVQEELIKFSGIGRKVADCVALFSLDQDDAIPVDVHVQHIASRDYDPTVLGEAKSITPTIYKRVGDLFRDRFASKPGWAHSLLFVAELPSFRGVLPADVVREMDEWKELEQRKKKESKQNAKSK